MPSTHHQSEIEALEIRKLRQELRHGRITLYLSILGSLLLLVGLVVDRFKAHEQRERELLMTLFAQKKEAYLALSDATCAIAACRTYEEVERAAPEFMKVYFGRAHLIAAGDDKVSNAKIAFREALDNYLAEKPLTPPKTYFHECVLAVTNACQRNLDPRMIEWPNQAPPQTAPRDTRAAARPAR